MTELKTKVTRRADASMVRDMGKMKPLVVTLYPGGVIGLRPSKTRREETVLLSTVYQRAVKDRVLLERKERKKKRVTGRR